jgi:hypothetical protein
MRSGPLCKAKSQPNAKRRLTGSGNAGELILLLFTELIKAAFYKKYRYGDGH